MYKTILVLLATLFIFSCASTNQNSIKLNKFMDPDTGVETVETIISFGEFDDPTQISFNQTKNLRNISWYIICKFSSKENKDCSTLDIMIDAKSNILKAGGSYNSQDLKTRNSTLFRKVDYFKINETIIADLNKCENLKLEFKGDKGSKEFYLGEEQLAAVKDWIKNITIPK